MHFSGAVQSVMSVVFKHFGAETEAEQLNTSPLLPRPSLPYPSLPYPHLPYPCLPPPSLPYPPLPNVTSKIEKLARLA